MCLYGDISEPVLLLLILVTITHHVILIILKPKHIPQIIHLIHLIIIFLLLLLLLTHHHPTTNTNKSIIIIIILIVVKIIQIYQLRPLIPMRTQSYQHSTLLVCCWSPTIIVHYIVSWHSQVMHSILIADYPTLHPADYLVSVIVIGCV